ncbi:MAG: energy transducer TonB [Xanthomonadaceae bacterium]|nr:energy transducer TonB [Xanthomonadaceae bacterium]MDP2184421.1 energy transducer TonB [Xanthomonadales bacterium]MDZ4115791.1 energy transducer TonB [Xanthomonadaceae bacterium]MDZ4379339.1 energy transducer TonB [Xanthomonadaceae bacterium]
MPSKPASKPAIDTLIRKQAGPGDRLSATLALSLIAHGVVLLGIGFAREDPAGVQPTLDVMLTETRSEKAPDHADFLAQASQRGGGDADVAERPREPQLGNVAREQPGVARQPLQAQAPAPQPPPTDRVVSTTEGDWPVPNAEDTPPERNPLLPLGPEWIERHVEMARLAAEVEQQTVAYARRPNEKRITASTREYAWAPYMRAWVNRVERIGNLNYPEQARQRRLQGRLVLTVSVRRDGSVQAIEVVESSGIALLDQSAVRIVRLAEPFPPLPETRERIELLHITRTWQFAAGSFSGQAQ